MKSTINYLDEAKAKIGIESDYGLSKFLGVSRQRLSMYRTGERVMDDYAAAKIAEILGIEAMMVIAAANAEREKTEEKREYWKNFYERLGGVAASIIFVVTFIVTPTPSQAAPMADMGVRHCILC